jgi:hypothetical protein
MRKHVFVFKEEEVIVRHKTSENCIVKSFTKYNEKIRWKIRYEGYGAQIREMAMHAKLKTRREDIILGDQTLI